MRYTTIHHDVRERFDLTVAEYMVCDSIHQLANRQPIAVPDVKIAKFLGLHRDTVNASKRILLQKGLLEQSNEGWSTTERWWQVVTFAKGYHDVLSENLTPKVSEKPKMSENTAPLSEKAVSTQYIYNKDIDEQARRESSPQEEDDIQVEADEEFAPVRGLKKSGPAPSEPLIDWASRKSGRRFASPLKQRKCIITLQAAGYDDEDIKAMWLDLEVDPFWANKGIDFGTVLSQADRLSARVDTSKLKGLYDTRIQEMNKMISSDIPREDVRKFIDEFIKPLRDKYGFR